MGTGENAGGEPYDGLASHPGRSGNTPSRFMLQQPEISAGLMGLPRVLVSRDFTLSNENCDGNKNITNLYL